MSGTDIYWCLLIFTDIYIIYLLFIFYVPDNYTIITIYRKIRKNRLTISLIPLFIEINFYFLYYFNLYFIYSFILVYFTLLLLIIPYYSLFIEVIEINFYYIIIILLLLHFFSIYYTFSFLTLILTHSHNYYKYLLYISLYHFIFIYY